VRGAPPAGRLLRAAAPVLLVALARAPSAAAATFHDTTAHLAILPARADGVALRLLLDTGDSRGLSIDAAAAGRLGLVVRPAAATAGERRGLFAPLAEPLGTARIEHLSIDVAAWEALDAVVIREDVALAAAVGAPYDGVIGAALLAGRCLVVDYPRRSVRFGDGREDCATSEAARRPALRYDGGYLVTDVDLGSGRRTALVDTASAVTFVDSRAAGPLHPATGDRRRFVDAGGTTAGLPRADIARLAAGGALLRGVGAFALDLAGIAGRPGAGAPPAAVLGADLLSRHRVVLDLVHGCFALETDPP
jgi:hypothetical protein